MPQLRRYEWLQLSKVALTARSLPRSLVHVLAAALVAWAALGASGCVSINLLEGRRQPLVETVVHGKSGPKILMLGIDGVIRDVPQRSQPFGPEPESMLARLTEELDRARGDDDVRALLLRINSPGGSVTASDVLYEEILRFKRERGVPVVAQIMGLGTSGAYYVAMSADRVLAQRTSVTGSIGVIFVGVSFAGLMEKLGIEDQTLTAGENKAAGSPLRRMTPEQKDRFESVLNDMHDRFKEVVARGRPGLDAERIASLADGSIFSGVQARANGLVDEIGDLEDAISAAEKAAGLESSRVVTYHRRREWKENIYNRPLVPPTLTLEFGAPFAPLEEPGFFYLWAPAAR